MQTNEIKVIKSFIQEFNPFYSKENLDPFSYSELADIIKEITKEL